MFNAIIHSAFLTAGQRCTGASRLIVVDCSNKLLFEEALMKRVLSLTVGAFTDNEEPFMGPVIHKQSYDFIYDMYLSFIEQKGRVVAPMTKRESTWFFSSTRYC